MGYKKGDIVKLINGKDISSFDKGDILKIVSKGIEAFSDTEYYKTIRVCKKYEDSKGTPLIQYFTQDDLSTVFKFNKQTKEEKLSKLYKAIDSLLSKTLSDEITEDEFYTRKDIHEVKIKEILKNR